ncbi:filamentous hemagglutinin transporter [Rhynchospora pubera]|uniref:Filamentous hemagglutinin transporter n=1 Tax=Rhynchospora pubera TaxID=906938 RepID=A0AAV8GH69_9POAL|nr:filamentous hemagglutinin transporter [Rhynchospora pubera]KAJ4804314.1 filamentous hemagglutinin transporter [Rhynchospora pubera]
MATEVGLMARLVSGYGKKAEPNGEKDPITRDLLGGCPVMGTKDLDLGLGIGSGSVVEKALDILPGKMYLPKKRTTNNNPLQDLNLPPTTISLHLPESSPKSLPTTPQTNYQSVCTIEKVKSALARMGRDSQSKSHAQSDGSPSPSSSSITSNSPIKRSVDQVDGCDSSATPVGGASMMAAACPKCLLYVLISKDNPRCPQCNSHVPPAVLSNNNNNSNKKPRINLNSTTLDLF